MQAINRVEGKINTILLAADEKNNAILISGNAADRTQIQKLIQSLDTADVNGNADTVVIHLNYLNAKKIAPMLTKIANVKMEEQKINKGKIQNSRFGMGGEGSNNGISKAST